MCKTVPELKPLLHIANLLASEMIHFIHQLAYYITFEVSWLSFFINFFSLTSSFTVCTANERVGVIQAGA